MKTSRIDSHLSEEPPSLPLKAEQLRALHGPASSETPTKHVTGEPPSMLQAEPGHLQVEPYYVDPGSPSSYVIYSFIKM